MPISATENKAVWIHFIMKKNTLVQQLEEYFAGLIDLNEWKLSGLTIEHSSERVKLAITVSYSLFIQNKGQEFRRKIKSIPDILSTLGSKRACITSWNAKLGLVLTTLAILAD